MRTTRADGTRGGAQRHSHREAVAVVPRGEILGPRGTLLGLLLSRGLLRLEQVADRVGRFCLYAGLLLVALVVLRGPGGLGTIADVFVFFSFLCALFLSARGRSIKIPVFQIHAIGIALFTCGIVGATLSESTSPWLSLANFSKFVFTTSCTFFSCVILIERQRQLRLALGCWVISAAVTSVFALLQLWLGDAVPGAQHAIWGRMAGLSGNAGGLGHIAAMAIAAGLSLAAAAQRLERILWLIMTLICVAGVIVSVSRAGALAGAVSLVLWAGMHYRLKREFTYLVAGGCLLVAVAGVFLYATGGQSGLYNRLSSAVSDPERDRAVQSRLFGYDVALDDALRNPLVGVGLAPEDADVYGQIVHNTFLLVLRAGGLLALVGICVILADALYKAFRTYLRSKDYETQVVAISLFAGIVGMTLVGMASPILYQREMWLPAALTFALQALAKRRKTRGHDRRLLSVRAGANPQQGAKPSGGKSARIA